LDREHALNEISRLDDEFASAEQEISDASATLEAANEAVVTARTAQQIFGERKDTAQKAAEIQQANAQRATAEAVRRDRETAELRERMRSYWRAGWGRPWREARTSLRAEGTIEVSSFRKEASDSLLSALQALRIDIQTGHGAPNATVRSVVDRRKDLDNDETDRLRAPFAFDRVAGPVILWLAEWEETDRLLPGRVETARARRARDLATLDREVQDQGAKLSDLRDALERDIERIFHQISHRYDDLDRRYGGFGARLNVKSIPPAGTDDPWVWEVEPQWRRSPTGRFVSYTRQMNDAQGKQHTIHLVLAALIATDNPAGRLLILDELGDKLDTENQRSLLEEIADVARTRTRHRARDLPGLAPRPGSADRGDWRGHLVRVRLESRPAQPSHQDVGLRRQPPEGAINSRRPAHRPTTALTWTVDRSAGLLLATPNGTVAYPIVQRRGDQEVRDRRGRRRVRRALVTSSQGLAEHPGLTDSEMGWVLGAPTRRAATIAGRFPDPDTTAQRLCRAGVVELVYEVTDDLQLGDLREWRLTPRWSERATDGNAATRIERQNQSEMAATTADKVAYLSPELASALRAVPPGDRCSPLAALVAAAQDLLKGRLHDGPRAFSQHHFGDGKVRDDIARLLADHGVLVDVADALGVRRSPRLGLAGPIIVRAAAVAALELDGWDGPIMMRADQPGLSVVPARPDLTLVVVENAQSAEWAADQHPEAIVIYTAGPLSAPAVQIVHDCSTLAARTIAVCDADLGGIRISTQIVTAVPTAEVIDIGRWPHTPGAAIGPGSVTDVGLRAALDGPVSQFAAAVLARGYRVEQEQPTTAALGDLLTRQYDLHPIAAIDVCKEER
jgi:hypothetical protein